MDHVYFYKTNGFKESGSQFYAIRNVEFAVSQMITVEKHIFLKFNDTISRGRSV